jgi:hypothetical protein
MHDIGVYVMFWISLIVGWRILRVTVGFVFLQLPSRFDGLKGRLNSRLVVER